MARSALSPKRVKRHHRRMASRRGDGALGHSMMTYSQGVALVEALAAPAPPISPSMQQAIDNYKKWKALEKA